MALKQKTFGYETKDEATNRYQSFFDGKNMVDFNEKGHVTKTNPNVKEKTQGDRQDGLSDAVLNALKDIYFPKEDSHIKTPETFDPYTQRDLNRHDRIINRAGNKVDRISGRINKNLERGNYDKVDKLRGKLDTNAASLASDISNSISTDWGGAGVAAVGALPGIVAGLSEKPETQGEANAGILSQAMQWGGVGLATGNPWIAGGAFVAGAAVGAINSRGMHPRNLERNNVAVENVQEDTVEERMKNYYDFNTSKQMQNQLDIMKQAQGMST